MATTKKRLTTTRKAKRPFTGCLLSLHGEGYAGFQHSKSKNGRSFAEAFSSGGTVFSAQITIVMMLTAILKILSFPFIALIKIYQWIISPWIGPKCRFTPTCSQYALEAIKKYGPFKGIWLAARRISRCHPWGGHGYDPVP